ncbi:MAG: DNA-binding response regulator [Proteobacteria bacterium]|nr:MAG: DNA-binding response regulator [Pseudomonadota bacterium]
MPTHQGNVMKILVIEDEKHIRQGIVQMLESEGFEVFEADSVTSALSLVHDDMFDVLLCDHHLPDGESFDILHGLPEKNPPPLIMMTAFGDRDLASQAFAAGAYDYVLKPIRFDELFARLKRLEEKLVLRQRVCESDEDVRNHGELAILGKSPVMQAVQDLIKTSASARVAVLLQGETGVGKGVVARLIHSLSKFKEEPFIRINCAAIPSELMESELFGHKKGAFSGADRDRKGLLASAGKGTLFLDELVELPLVMQSKLLHVLDESSFRPVGGDKEFPFQARVIAASNVDFEQAVKDGRFREDLYFRLNIMQITIPPLRQRMHDIIPLTHRLLGQICDAWGHHQPSLTKVQELWLESQHWRGNVRELRNVLERALLLGTDSTLKLPDMEQPFVSEPLSLSDACHSFEQRYIQQTLDQNKGDKAKAAQILGIALSSLYRKLEG